MAFGSKFFALSLAFLAACSGGTSPVRDLARDAGPSPDGGGGGGGKEGEEPAEVAVEKWEASPGADCPSPYSDRAPVSGANRGFPSAGQTRDFYLLLPNDLAEPRPVFVAFNGTGESGSTFARRANLKEFADAGFIVLAPSSNGNGTRWPVWDAMRSAEEDREPNADLAYFDDLLKCTAAHFPVDKNRVYAGGHSAGGIMTNYLAQRRSEVLAGAIVASGVFSFTGPEEKKPLDKMAVLVTWGGDNDSYQGSAGGVSVPGINFVEQASLASVFYSKEGAVGQANCRGANLGHAWLPINGFFVDFMLAHPKGKPGKTKMELGETGSNRATCTTEPFVFKPTVSVECPTSTTDGCQAACQLFGDCAVENGTVGSVMSQQLRTLGFSGNKNAECGGCVTRCASKATAAADVDVLKCFADAQGASQCGPGVEGAAPLIDAVNNCCEGKTDSGYCTDVCRAILTNTAAASFFPGCEAFGK